MDHSCYSYVKMDKNSNQPGGIYVHIPYCVRKCPYCDFYSCADRSSLPVFLECLEREMEMVAETYLIFDTLYLGGGTPSIIEPTALGRIIDAVNRYFNLQAAAEITLEVNPGTVSREKFAQYRQAGINRLNIGIQSFNSANLEFLERIHAVADAVSSIEWARQAGFDNIGIDLIYGLPGQHRQTWLADLDSAHRTQVSHLSCYILTAETETPLGRDVKAGNIRMPGDDAVRELFDATIDHLTTHGFEQYEISNFAKKTTDGSPPPYSRHNQKYWSLAPYLGLGPSAHSFMSPQRRWNHRSIEKYVGRIQAGRLPVAGRERLTREQMIIEAVYLGLRTTRGIELNRFEKMFDMNFEKFFDETIAELAKKDFIVLTQTRCALTPRGMAYHDSIAAMLTGQNFPQV